MVDRGGPAPRTVPDRGWVMVRATHLTPENIVLAVKRGDFYASSGVELREVYFDESAQTLRVNVEPAGNATFTTRFNIHPKRLC